MQNEIQKEAAGPASGLPRPLCERRAENQKQLESENTRAGRQRRKEDLHPWLHPDSQTSSVLTIMLLKL